MRVVLVAVSLIIALVFAWPTLWSPPSEESSSSSEEEEEEEKAKNCKKEYNWKSGVHLIFEMFTGRYIYKVITKSQSSKTDY
eukprot:g3470.t1